MSPKIYIQNVRHLHLCAVDASWTLAEVQRYTESAIAQRRDQLRAR
jgi:hypothetical protein